MDIENLTLQNPWWKGKEHFEEDEDYRKWKESKIRWVPKLLDRIELKPFSLHFIFGPRQVGKTTLVKLLIRKLLEDTRPESIFYFKCDQLANYKELDEVLKVYLEFRKSKGIERSYIFLDEVTFPREWFRTIKFLIDIGRFRQDVLILTGSLSMVAKGEIETFPGRRGHGRDFVLSPLSFREFVKVANSEIYKTLPRLKSLELKEIREKCFVTLPYFKELNEIFKLYLRCGGFPLAVRSYLTKNKLTNEVRRTYLSWLRGDVLKLNRSPETVKLVVKALLEKDPSAISWHSIAKEFELKSHRTVYQYINLLSELWVVNILYWINPSSANISFLKNKKVHFTDPFFYDLFSVWCLTKPKAESTIVESIVASHLSRKREVTYWKNKGEVDVIIKNKELLGFEVKWKEKPEIKRIKMGKLKEIITLTKKTFNRDPLAVPVSSFLACLDV